MWPSERSSIRANKHYDLGLNMGRLKVADEDHVRQQGRI